MTVRVHAVRGGHPHLAWESQPLVGPLPRRRVFGARAVMLAFAVGIVIGLFIR